MAVHKGVGHYGAPITLEQAKKVMAAAEAKALQSNWYVAISIMDSGGKRPSHIEDSIIATDDVPIRSHGANPCGWNSGMTMFIKPNCTLCHSRLHRAQVLG